VIRKLRLTVLAVVFVGLVVAAYAVRHAQRTQNVPHKPQPSRKLPQNLECSKAVIDVWNDYSNEEKAFLSKYAQASEDEQKKMNDDAKKLFDMPGDKYSKRLETVARWHLQNAANYASVGVYLIPRDRPKAVEMMDKALSIKNDPAYHYLKSYALVGQMVMGDFLFTTAGGDIYKENKDAYEQEIQAAIKLDPNNGFLDYSLAIFYGTHVDDTVAAIKWMRSGNGKSAFHFYLPPPLPTRITYWGELESLQGKFPDLETNFGLYRLAELQMLIYRIGEYARAKNEPDLFSDLASLIFNATNTTPLDRPYFSLYDVLLQSMQKYYKGKGDKARLAAVDKAFKLEKDVTHEVFVKLRTEEIALIMENQFVLNYYEEALKRKKLIFDAVSDPIGAMRGHIASIVADGKF